MSVVRIVGKIFSWLVTAFLALLLLTNLYMIGARHFTGTAQPAVFGWSWAVVISGSMEPEIRVDDLVVVHKEDSYAVGDVITFQSGSSVVTHRIAAQTPKGYITRGDANNTDDLSPVPQSSVIGKVAYVVPGVGLLIQYLRTPLGMTCMILIGFLLIEIPYMLDKHKNEEGGRREL